MTPLRYDFPSITRGDSERFAVVFKDRALFSGALSATNLDGAAITWTVRRPGQADLVKTIGQGLVLDPGTATLIWTVSAPDVASLATGANPYVLRIVQADGQVRTELTGTITIEDYP